MSAIPYSQSTLARGYIPMPRRPINFSVEVPIRQSLTLPSGARYTVYEPCSAWGSGEDMPRISTKLRARK